MRLALSPMRAIYLWKVHGDGEYDYEYPSTSSGY